MLTDKKRGLFLYFIYLKKYTAGKKMNDLTIIIVMGSWVYSQKVWISTSLLLLGYLNKTLNA